jgi:hypothetical protein
MRRREKYVAAALHHNPPLPRGEGLGEGCGERLLLVRWLLHSVTPRPTASLIRPSGTFSPREKGKTESYLRRKLSMF